MYYVQHYISFISTCFLLVVVLIYLFLFYTLTVEMARRKLNLCMRSKSATVEGASTEHVDQETNQEMHEASTQGMGLQLDINLFFNCR